MAESLRLSRVLPGCHDGRVNCRIVYIKDCHRLKHPRQLSPPSSMSGMSKMGWRPDDLLQGSRADGQEILLKPYTHLGPYPVGAAQSIETDPCARSHRAVHLTTSSNMSGPVGRTDRGRTLSLAPWSPAASMSRSDSRWGSVQFGEEQNISST